MALDTFAKRLASQGRPSPGDINVDDRWAIGGAFKPSVSFAAALIMAAGASVAALSGTFTPATLSAFNQADRFHIEHRPFPGDQQIENRFAVGGSFLHLPGSTDIGGAIAAHSAAASAQFLGTASTGPPPPASFDPDDRWHLEWRPYPANGVIGREDRFALSGHPFRDTAIQAAGGGFAATSAPSTAHFAGVTYYSIFFDVGFSVTPALTISDLAPSSGTLTAQATACLAAFRGATLPPNSENGYIAANAAASTTAFTGTFVLAPGRDGRVHADSSLAVSRMRGTVVPPTGRIGKIAAAASASSAQLSGTFAKFRTDGRLAATVDPSTTNWFGVSLLPGTIYGFVQATTQPMTAHLRGTTEIGSPGSVIGRRGRGHVRGVKASATIRNIRGKGET